MTHQDTPDAADIAGALQAAIAHHQGGRLADAEASYRQVLRTAPHHADALHLLGLVLAQSGNYQGAVELFKQAIRAAPAAFTYYNSLGNALHALGQLDAAAVNLRQAVKLSPDYAEAQLNLGNVLQDQGQLADAVASYRLALAAQPEYAAAHINLGNALQDQGLLKDAAASYGRALKIDPGYAAAHGNLGNVLCDLGQFDAAVASYRAALALAPDLAEIRSSLLFTMAYRGSATPQEYLREARQWELGSVPAPAREAARARRFERRSPVNRRLRVGYVSGDFRQHPVSYFVEQLLAHHDGGLFEIFSYSTCAIQDDTTDRLRKLSEHWRSLVEGQRRSRAPASRRRPDRRAG
ncbi:MAG: tetratricopeptide repeat protein [Rhodospirillales bacterium]